jgi:hypothetical protein
MVGPNVGELPATLNTTFRQRDCIPERGTEDRRAEKTLPALPPSVRRLDASLSLKANLAVGRSLPQVALVTEFESFRSAFSVVHQSAFVEEAAPLTYWGSFGQLCATEGFDLMSDAVLEGALTTGQRAFHEVEPRLLPNTPMAWESL